MPDFSIVQSAFSAFGHAQGNTAHNIANSFTNGYTAGRVSLETGPSGKGVRAQASSQPADAQHVDLPREFAQLNVTQTAYSATAATIRTLDEMTGSILNVKV